MADDNNKNTASVDPVEEKAQNNTIGPSSAMDPREVEVHSDGAEQSNTAIPDNEKEHINTAADSNKAEPTANPAEKKEHNNATEASNNGQQSRTLESVESRHLESVESHSTLADANEPSADAEKKEPSEPQDSSSNSLSPPVFRPQASFRRPQAERGDTAATSASQMTAEELRKEETGMPALKREYTRLANKQANPWEHWGITLGLPMMILFDVVVPCIIYYVWYDIHKSRWRRNCRPYREQGVDCPFQKREFDKDIMGYAIISFGFGELWILGARVLRLFRHREQCAPLLSRNKWELDATSWVYAVAMLMALIPFVIGSSLVIPELYLYSPAVLMAFLGSIMVVTTLHPFKIPIGINSHARGSGLRPFIYYAAEDFIAVDGLQDREFRVRYNERYESSKPFRRMFVYLTLWWELGVLIYIGISSAVIWTCPFHIAFGLTLGVLFCWIIVWAASTYAYVMWEMKRQRRLFEAGKITG